MYKNKNGTSDRSCKCGSWKQHWINCSHQSWPLTCSVVGCNYKAELGAHIISSISNSEYIVPMCDECNKRTDNFNLKSIKLISANKQQTCEKSNYNWF